MLHDNLAPFNEPHSFTKLILSYPEKKSVKRLVTGLLIKSIKIFAKKDLENFYLDKTFVTNIQSLLH